MSSSPLYLAIVVVWLIVLVPMLLRKDAVEPVHEETRRDDADPDTDEVDETFEEEESDEEDPDLTETRVVTRPRAHREHADEEAEESRPVERRRIPAPEPRARVIARRRRRTSALTLLNVSTIVAVAFGLGPWWVIAPPILLLVGHLALLREAAKADAEQRQARLKARRRALLRARRDRDRQEHEAREAERLAKVIALQERRSQVYDQYADARLRAAGD
ncbi:MAG TPA: hypothetical protein K8V84_10965 [Nocardiopsis listeri]|uniref:divisome protein SepX/GlpR n=1 Tax=Nocardiopsis listeri TaxID=53440 RepID=UPI001D5967CE|nr:hypothetical protein [Nocardiopsis listeri]HJE59010.1 hypothetical protein [Nocardiopsis listeri]